MNVKIPINLHQKSIETNIWGHSAGIDRSASNQEEIYLPYDEISGDEFEYLSETLNIEKHPDTISDWKTGKCSRTQFFKKISSILILWFLLVKIVDENFHYEFCLALKFFTSIVFPRKRSRAYNSSASWRVWSVE